LTLQLSVTGQTTSINNFAFGPPTISSVSTPDGMPTIGGTNVTIAGANFGLTGTAAIGGVPCPILAQSHVLLVCRLPSGSGSNLAVVVTVQGRPSNSVLVSYAPPQLTAILPIIGPTSGSIPVNLTGSNFGLTGSATVGGRSCIPTGLGWSHTFIQCNLPTGVGANQPVLVTTGGQTSAQVVLFSYFSPTVASINPVNGPTQGASALTITGTNFGDGSIGNASANVGGVDCPITFRQDSFIVCSLPAGFGSGVVSVNISGQVPGPASTVTFTYDPPSIYTITPRNVLTNGNVSVTLGGISFSSPPGTVTLTTMGSTVLAPILNWSETRVIFTLPPGEGLLQTVTLTTSHASSASTQINFNAPTITGISPLQISTDGTNLLTVTGTSFSSNLSTSTTVTVGGVPCVPITTHINEQIVCVVPAGQGPAVPVIVTVASQTSASFQLTFSNPNITSISPPNASTSGAINLTLTGTNFGTSQGSVTLGSSSCPIVSQTHTSIICTLPPGQGTGLQVRVVVSTLASNILLWSYNSPVLGSLVPNHGPTSSGYPLTVVGSNFGSPTASVSVSFGVLSCAVSSFNDTVIICTVPQSQSQDNQVSVTVSGQASSNALTFSYDGSLIAVSSTTLLPWGGPLKAVESFTGNRAVTGHLKQR
jgi:hypothetical protein